MATKDITADRLRELLHYDPETGVFTWIVRTNNSVNVGTTAGRCATGNGYRYIGINGEKYLASRLAWFYTHGRWPDLYIDHLDGEPLNNRIANLRNVSHKINQQNRRRPNKSNKTGFLGVSTEWRTGRYVSSVCVDGKTIHLGAFDTPEEAHSAYLIAKRKMHAGCTI